MFLSTRNAFKKTHWQLLLIFNASLLGFCGCLSTEQQVVSVLGPWMIMSEPAAADLPATNRVDDGETAEAEVVDPPSPDAGE